MGVYVDLKASLNLKVDHPQSNSPINLGYIHKNGTLWTSPLANSVPQAIAMRYNESLSTLIGGAVAVVGSGSYVSTNGKSVPLITALLPDHAEA
jgi:hypothetical protein